MFYNLYRLTLFNRSHNPYKYIIIPFSFTLYDIVSMMKQFIKNYPFLSKYTKIESLKYSRNPNYKFNVAFTSKKHIFVV